MVRPDVLMVGAGIADGVATRARVKHFRVRKLDGVANDWPLSYAELQPYYESTDAAIPVPALPSDLSEPHANVHARVTPR